MFVPKVSVTIKNVAYVQQKQCYTLPRYTETQLLTNTLKNSSWQQQSNLVTANMPINSNIFYYSNDSL